MADIKSTTEKKVAISITSLNKSYGKKHVLKGVRDSRATTKTRCKALLACDLKGPDQRPTSITFNSQLDLETRWKSPPRSPGCVWKGP